MRTLKARILVWNTVFLVALGVLLDEANVPSEGRFAAVPPWFYALLKKDTRFTHSTPMGDQLLRTGVAGDIDGDHGEIGGSPCGQRLEHPAFCIDARSMPPVLSGDLRLNELAPGLGLLAKLVGRLVAEAVGAGSQGRQRDERLPLVIVREGAGGQLLPVFPA